MPAELKWTTETPTVPGLYMWRDDRRIGGFGAIRVVENPEGIGQLVARESDDPERRWMYLVTFAGSEFLGPLPE